MACTQDKSKIGLTAGWNRLVGHALFPVLVFAVAAVVTLFPILTADNLAGDDSSLAFPLFSLVKGFALSGDLPLWNPYRFSGVTLIANPGNGLFYPLTLPLLAFSTDATLAIKLVPVLHLALIGYFTCLFLRQLGVTRAGGLVGGLVFMLNGAVLTKFANGNGGLTWTFVWIPLTLYLLERTIRKPDKTKVLSLGLVVAMQVLAGYPGTIYYAGVLLYTPYFLCRLGTHRQQLAPRPLARIALVLFSATAIGLLLGGPLLMVSAEIGSLSTRQDGLSYEASASLGLPLPSLITAVFPWFWGGMGGKGTYWGTGYFDLTQIYVGLLPLVLAATAVVTRRSWLRAALLLAGASALLLALSDSLPFYRFFYYAFPGASLFRHPFKFMFIFSFAMAALAAMGYDEVVSRLKSIRPGRPWAGKVLLPLVVFLPLGIAGGGLIFRKLLLSVFAARFPRFAYLDVRSEDFYLGGAIIFLAGLNLYFLLAGRIRLPAFKWLLIALIALDLVSYGVVLTPIGLTSSKHESDPVVEFLKRDSALFRIYSVNSQLTGVDPFGYENRGMEQRIQSIDGYDPVVLRKYEEYANAASGRPISHRDGTGVSVEFDFKNPRLFDLLNVKYVLSDEPIGHDSLQPVPTQAIYGRSRRHGDAYLYVNKGMQARFSLFDRFEVLSEPAAILDRLADRGATPSQTLYVEEDIATDSRPDLRRPGDADVIEIVSYEPAEIRLRTRTAGRRLLFASEMYYPGWEAWVDGAERSIYRTNYLFRAVAIDAGEHEIRFTYRPRSLEVGLLLAAAGGGALLVLSLVTLAGLLRNRGKRKREG